MYRPGTRAVSPFYWTLAEFCQDELLPFVFAGAEDERAQYTMLIAQVAARLRREGVLPGMRERSGSALWIDGSASAVLVWRFRLELRSAARPLTL